MTLLTKFKITFFNCLPLRYKEYHREKRRIEASIKQYFDYDKYQTGHYYSSCCFDYYKCIFVHIPKAAGISVNKTLFDTLGAGHLTVKEYQEIFHPTTFSNYFKFTFVRNPWDRLFSAYTFLKKGGFNEYDKKWAEEHLSDIDTFEKFVMDWLDESKLYSWFHFIPQAHFLKDNKGNIPIDYFGYYENLNEDFNIISKRIGINKSLGHFNKTHRTNSYRNAYSEEMKKKVGKIYQEDIELLGYNFEGVVNRINLK